MTDARDRGRISVAFLAAHAAQADAILASADRVVAGARDAVASGPSVERF